MPDRDVRWLEEVGRADTALVGGKAANLGAMLAHGFPVPPGFVVTAPACQRCFDALALSGDIAKLSSAAAADVESGREAIAAKIRATAIPAALEDAIVAAHATLRARCGEGLVCAVRSSATAEDLGAASFAGQHGTYYYVDAAQLIPMIRSCWASLWSHEAVSYRAANGIEHATTYMAVLVQQMIPAEVSGVTFTVNPVTGARDEVVVESSWGMGAGIVDGRVTPDRYVLRRDGLVLKELRIAQKRLRVSTTLRKDAVARVVQVSVAQRQAATLTTDLVVTIARWALRAEERFGSPQDVEWAVAEDRVHVLQSRPVTVSGRKEFCRNAAGRSYVLFKALIENFTDPLTPLTANLFLQGPLARCFALIGGRVYLDVGLVRSIVPLRLTEGELAQLLYLTDEGVAPALKLSLARLPAAALVGLALAAICTNLYTRTAYLPPGFLDGFRRAAEGADADAELGVKDTWRGLLLGPSLRAMLLAPAGRHVMAVNGSAVRYFIWMAVLKKVLRRYLPDLPRDALGLLTSGSEGVLSAEAGRRIWVLAQEARRSETVRQLLLANPPERALPLLRGSPDATAFVAQLDAFLATFGHRALKEFELRSPRWEEEPAPVLGMVRNYLLAESDPAEHERRVAQRRADLERRIHDQLGRRPLERVLGLRRRLVRYLAARVKYFATMRENSRFYWIMAAHITRKKILRLETRLIAEGRLKCRDDIFYLECAEIEQLERGSLGWQDVEERIAERRREYVRLSKITPPRTIGIAAAAAPAAAEPDAVDGVVLRGQTASSGRCEGVARVILDPTVDVELRPGEVLVAPYTDPAWTPLFLTAGAAVVEVGSFLSHAGTVAREYGLPCVVDVPDCTTRIRTGDRLLVDGDDGTVRVLA
ncbi:MAG: PEP/pyruvate-binding domain-containing protein [Gemmatimonadota bacterium]